MKALTTVLLFGIFITARAGVVNYAYDDAGRLTRVDYPSGASILYTYDNAGNLLSRTVNGPSGNQARPARKESPGAQLRRTSKSPYPKRKRGFNTTQSR